MRFSKLPTMNSDSQPSFSNSQYTLIQDKIGCKLFYGGEGLRPKSAPCLQYYTASYSFSLSAISKIATTSKEPVCPRFSKLPTMNSDSQPSFSNSQYTLIQDKIGCKLFYGGEGLRPKSAPCLQYYTASYSFSLSAISKIATTSKEPVCPRVELKQEPFHNNGAIYRVAI